MTRDRQHRSIIAKLIRALAASPTCPRAFVRGDVFVECALCNVCGGPTPMQIERCWRRSIKEGRLKDLHLGRNYMVCW